jgi:two-component system alkaline phosphatase synthesis response regulator PhoP
MREMTAFQSTDTAGMPDQMERTISVPLTPRELYALTLVAELVSTLRDAPATAARGLKPKKFVFGDVTLDVHRREVRMNGTPVHLTPREYEVLVALAEEEGAPVSKEQLRRDVWKNSIGPRSRAIEQNIVELRRKLEKNPRKPRYITISRKFGYALDGQWMEDEAPGITAPGQTPRPRVPFSRREGLPAESG